MARARTPDVRPNVRCSCGNDLVWSPRPYAWVCPKVVKTSLEGLLEPQRENWRNEEIMRLRDEGHITCLPHELIDDSRPPDSGAFVNRAGGKLSALEGKVERPKRDEDGNIIIYDDRGVALPRSHQSYQTLNTWQCDDCGVRTPSEVQMREHLRKMGHRGAETPAGKRLKVEFLGTEAIVWEEGGKEIVREADRP